MSTPTTQTTPTKRRAASVPRSGWTPLAATVATALALLATAACTKASDGLSGASLPPPGGSGDAASVGAGNAAADTTPEAPLADAITDTLTGAGDAADPLAVGPRPTIGIKLVIKLSNPANPVDALGQLHNDGVEALWQQRAQWVVGGRIDDRKALALTIAWLCQNKAKLPKLPPWGPSTGPTFPTDPCDPSWPTRLQALPAQRTLPIDQIYALAGYTAADKRFVNAVLAEQAAALASDADPTARIQAIIRLEAGAGRVIPGPQAAGADGETGADTGADASTSADGAADAATGADASVGAALTDSLAADIAAVDGVTDAATVDGGIGAAAGPVPTVAPICPDYCSMVSSVARHSLGYWHGQRTTNAAARWQALLPVTPPPDRKAAPAPTPKPKDWGKIGKADVSGAAAGGAVGGFWGGLIGAVLFSAVEGFTQ